jgi:hypothetical protein
MHRSSSSAGNSAACSVAAAASLRPAHTAGPTQQLRRRRCWCGQRRHCSAAAAASLRQRGNSVALAAAPKQCTCSEVGGERCSAFAARCHSSLMSDVCACGHVTACACVMSSQRLTASMHLFCVPARRGRGGETCACACELVPTHNRSRPQHSYICQRTSPFPAACHATQPLHSASAICSPTFAATKVEKGQKGLHTNRLDECHMLSALTAPTSALRMGSACLCRRACQRQQRSNCTPKRSHLQ